MRKFRVLAIMICILALCCLKVNASSVEIIMPVNIEEMPCEIIDALECSQDKQLRARNKIEWTVSSKKIMKSNEAFSLEAQEVVTINCTFSPMDANVDFGLIAPNGFFYYENVAGGGSFRQSIRVNETGEYYLAIRNNSSNAVEILGFVYY